MAKSQLRSVCKGFWKQQLTTQLCILSHAWAERGKQSSQCTGNTAATLTYRHDELRSQESRRQRQVSGFLDFIRANQISNLKIHRPFELDLWCANEHSWKADPNTFLSLLKWEKEPREHRNPIKQNSCENGEVPNKFPLWQHKNVLCCGGGPPEAPMITYECKQTHCYPAGDLISQPALQLGMVMWFRFCQWDGSASNMCNFYLNCLKLLRKWARTVPSRWQRNMMEGSQDPLWPQRANKPHRLGLLSGRAYFILRSHYYINSLSFCPNTIIQRKCSERD